MGKFNTKILLALTAFAVTTHLNLIPAVAYAEEIVEDVPPTNSSVVVDDAQTPTIEDSSIVEETPEAEESVENSAIEEPEEVISESSVAEGVTEESTENEPADKLIPETETSKWFDEYIMPMLVGLFAPLAGTITGGGIIGYLLVKGVKLLKGLMQDSLKSLKEAKGEADKSCENYLETAKLMVEVMDKLEKFMSDSQMNNQQNIDAIRTQLQEQVNEIFEQIRETMTDKIEDTNAMVNKLLEIENIVYGDNPVLVSNGTANKIAEVIDR